MFTWAFESLIISMLMAALATFACRCARLRPALCHLIWLVVVARMIVPPVITWPYSLEDISSRAFGWRHAAASQPVFPEATVSASRPVAVLKAQGLPSGAAAATPLPTRHLFEREDLFMAVGGTWVLGSMLVLLVQGVRICRFVRRASRGYCAPPWIIGMTESMAGQLGVVPPRTWVVPGIASPMAWGVMRKTIFLPESAVQTLGRDRWPGILAHELAHLKRRDDWAGWVELIAGCVQWWNPVFWHAARRLHEYSELACDAWVVWALPERRREYADTLVCAAELAASRRQPAPVMGMGHGPAVAFERRLLVILGGKASQHLSRLGLAGVLAFGALTLPSWPQNSSAASRETAAIPGEGPESPQSLPAPVSSFQESLRLPVSLEFEDIHVNEICSFIANTYRIYAVLDWRVIQPPPHPNAVKTPSTSGGSGVFVTDGIVRHVDMKDVSAKQAFQALAIGLNLTCVFEANAVWITSAAMLDADSQRDLPEPTALEASLRDAMALPVSMEFEDIHVNDVMEFIADSWNLNIVVDQRVIRPKEGAPSAENATQYVTDGRIPYIEVKDIPLVEALDLLVRSLDLVVLPKQNMLWITSYDHAFEPFGEGLAAAFKRHIRPLAYINRTNKGFAVRFDVDGETVEVEEGGLVGEYKVQHISLDDMTVQLRRQSDGLIRTFVVPIPLKEPGNPAPADIVALRCLQLRNGLLLAHLRLGTVSAWLRQGEGMEGWTFDGVVFERGEIRLIRNGDKYVIYPVPPDGIVQVPWNDPPAGLRLKGIQLTDNRARATMEIDGHPSRWLAIGARTERFIMLDIVPGAGVITVFDQREEKAFVLQEGPGGSGLK